MTPKPKLRRSLSGCEVLISLMFTRRFRTKQVIKVMRDEGLKLKIREDVECLKNNTCYISGLES